MGRPFLLCQGLIPNSHPFPISVTGEASRCEGELESVSAAVGPQLKEWKTSRAEPILTVPPGCSLEEAVSSLIEATEGAQAVRWLEFPAAVLLFDTSFLPACGSHSHG